MLQQLAERVEIGVARRVEVQPEELLALVQRADRVEVDGVENLHPAPPKLAAAPDSGVAQTASASAASASARLDGVRRADLGRSLGAVGDQQPRQQRAEEGDARHRCAGRR